MAVDGTQKSAAIYFYLFYPLTKHIKIISLSQFKFIKLMRLVDTYISNQPNHVKNTARFIADMYQVEPCIDFLSAPIAVGIQQDHRGNKASHMQG